MTLTKTLVDFLHSVQALMDPWTKLPDTCYQWEVAGGTSRGTPSWPGQHSTHIVTFYSLIRYAPMNSELGGNVRISLIQHRKQWHSISTYIT